MLCMIRQKMTGGDIRQKMVYLVQFQLTCVPVMLSGIEAETVSTFLRTAELRISFRVSSCSDSVFDTQLPFCVQVLEQVHFIIYKVNNSDMFLSNVIQ